MILLILNPSIAFCLKSFFFFLFCFLRLIILQNSTSSNISIDHIYFYIAKPDTDREVSPTNDPSNKRAKKGTEIKIKIQVHTRALQEEACVPSTG